MEVDKEDRGNILHGVYRQSTTKKPPTTTIWIQRTHHRYFHIKEEEKVKHVPFCFCQIFTKRGGHAPIRNLNGIKIRGHKIMASEAKYKRSYMNEMSSQERMKKEWKVVSERKDN